MVLAACLSVGGCLGNFVGYKRGYSTGVHITKEQMTADFESEIDWYRNQAYNRYGDGYDSGKEDAEYDCKQQLEIGNNLCKEDLKEAYKLGQLSGIRSVAIKCGRSK